MTDYRTSSHAKYSIHLHFVWVTKYRKKVLRGEIAKRLRKLIREICLASDIEILRGHVSGNHVHILVSISPYLSVSKVMKSIKGRYSRKLQQEYTELRKKFCG